MILLPETKIDAAKKVADKIRRAVEVHHFPFQNQKAGGKLTISVGIASYPNTHVTSDQDLVEASDKALYDAKTKGRNRIVLFSTSDGHHSKPRHHATPQRRAKESLSKK